MAAATMLAEGHDGRTVIGARSVPAWRVCGNHCQGLVELRPAIRPFVGNAKPFVVESASQFRTAGPYPLNSAAWAADFNEVKVLGVWNSRLSQV